MNKNTSIAESDILISEYVKKIKDGQINTKQAVADLMVNQNIREYYDKADLELILDFESD